jgi:tetratricopeptide (TPR) repeat protein
MLGAAMAVTSHLERAVALHERAIALREAARLPDAERSCRRALALYARAEGIRHPDVANALVELGQILEARDDLAGARRCHLRALAILGTRAPAADADLARLRVRARVLLGGLERMLGHHAASDRLFAVALRDVRRRFGARDPDVAGIYNNLGVLRKAEGRFAEAARFYRRALPMVKAWGDRGALATLHHNMGGIEHARGRYAAGEPHARCSVALRRAELGAGHPTVAADVAALAALVEGRGRLAEAARLYGRALAVFRRRLGPASSEAGFALASLAALRGKQGRGREARRLYAQALAIQRRVLGRGHPEVALTVNNLAYLLRQLGDLPEAERLYRRALAVFERRLGPRHPHTRLCRRNLRAVRRERGAQLKAKRRNRR